MRAITVDILQSTDQGVAVGKIADALQQFASEQPVPIEPMHASLYALALARIDFFTLALELLLNAEASDPALIKQVTSLDHHRRQNYHGHKPISPFQRG